MLEINSAGSQETMALVSCVTLASLESGFHEGIEFK